MSRDEALTLALEALEWNMAYLPTSHDDDGTTMAIEAVAAIKAALAQPEQEIDWKDMYDKEKRRSAMWLAKYEAVAGPALKAYPQVQPEQEPTGIREIRVTETVKQEQEPVIDCPFCLHSFRLRDVYTTPPKELNK